MIDEAQVIVSIGVIRVDVQGLFELPGSLVQIAPAEITDTETGVSLGIAEILPGNGIARVDLERLLKLGD